MTDQYCAVVENTLDRLRDDYDEVPIRRTEWCVDRETYEQTRERAAAGTVGGAGVWVRRVVDGVTEALVVRERDADGWSEPAGKQEPGERLEATARRETREETGVDPELTGVRLATRARHVHGDRPPIDRLVVVFDAVPAGDDTAFDPADATALDPAETEIDDARWVREHPSPLRYDAVASFPIEPPER
ncbi:NUDIX domain-containing protein [Halobaculum sp. MBLA0143]|uniref:NUDIX domain-containing protein n=1 Tax=Halobaculum sp. MBLA0143 TaxID=3079933 RepID=UPI003524466E